MNDTVAVVEKYLNSNKIERVISDKNELLETRRQFGSPISALQKFDWELPYEVEKTFYAVYNLITGLLGDEITIFNEPTI